MNAKSKLSGAMGKMNQSVSATTQREKLGDLPKPPVTAIPAVKTAARSLRMRPDLLEKLLAAPVALTVHRGEKVSLTDATNEMVAEYIARVEKLIGKSL